MRAFRIAVALAVIVGVLNIAIEGINWIGCCAVIFGALSLWILRKPIGRW
jgi:ABC-type uncharacterized transport system permease subunit